MTKLLFQEKVERANQLLGFVHYDVCGPLKTNAKGVYSYFINSPNDMSRYGYICWHLVNHT